VVSAESCGIGAPKTVKFVPTKDSKAALRLGVRDKVVAGIYR
jgi:hypothetical protein